MTLRRIGAWGLVVFLVLLAPAQPIALVAAVGLAIALASGRIG